MGRYLMSVFLPALGLILSVAPLDARAESKTTLVVMIRGLDNPYHANYAVGAKELGKKLGLPVDVLTSEAKQPEAIRGPQGRDRQDGRQHGRERRPQ